MANDSWTASISDASKLPETLANLKAAREAKAAIEEQHAELDAALTAKRAELAQLEQVAPPMSAPKAA